jgi:iron complex outermembrane receptor protein
VFSLASGQLIASASGTWVHDYRSMDLPDSPATERVGIADVFGTITRWRANASLNYVRGAWSVGATGRLTADYDDAVGVPGMRTGRRIDVPTYLDVQCGWSAERVPAAEGILRGVTFTLGASNVLDAQVPFAEIGDYLGVDMSQSDLRGRFIYANLSKGF